MLLQPSSCRGSLGCSGVPSTQRSLCKAPEHKERSPCAFAEVKIPEITGMQECATATDPPGSLGGAQTSQFYKMLTGNSRDFWYPSSAIAQFLNKFYSCRNRAELDHSIFLKDKHHNPNHVCICWKYKSCVGNRTLGSLELTGLNSGYLQLLLWFCFVSICSWRFWRMNCLYHSRLSHADLMANISKENITKQRPRLSHPGTSWLSGSCSTQLSSLCTYIFMYLYLYVLISLCIYNFMYLYLYVFISSLSIFVRQPNCFEISYILWIPKVNYTVGCEQTEPNTPTNTHTWFAQISSSPVCCLIITFLFHCLFPCLHQYRGWKGAFPTPLSYVLTN